MDRAGPGIWHFSGALLLMEDGGQLIKWRRRGNVRLKQASRAMSKRPVSDDRRRPNAREFGNPFYTYVDLSFLSVHAYVRGTLDMK